MIICPVGVDKKKKDGIMWCMLREKCDRGAADKSSAGINTGMFSTKGDAAEETGWFRMTCYLVRRSTVYELSLFVSL